MKSKVKKVKREYKKINETNKNLKIGKIIGIFLLIIVLAIGSGFGVYTFLKNKDPHGNFDKWIKEIEEKRARQYEQNISNQTNNSYNEDRVEYGFIRDDNGNLTTYSKSQLKDANGRVYSENVHFKDDDGNDHNIFISK